MSYIITFKYPKDGTLPFNYSAEVNFFPEEIKKWFKTFIKDGVVYEITIFRMIDNSNLHAFIAVSELEIEIIPEERIFNDNSKWIIEKNPNLFIFYFTNMWFRHTYIFTEERRDSVLTLFEEKYIEHGGKIPCLCRDVQINFTY